MYNSSRTGSLRNAVALGKVASPAGGRQQTSVIVGALAILAGGLLPACRLVPTTRAIRLTDLEQAPRVTVPAGQRITVADPTALHELCTPLGPRLGLLQV